VEPHYLTRVRLRQNASLAALVPVLLPPDPNERVGVAHRLMWTLFADHAERRRDFLWREEERSDPRPGRSSFLVLSRRVPDSRHDLFDMDPPKTFAPALAKGDRLAFSLRVNPVITRWEDGGSERRRRRHDIVMDRLRRDGGSRAERRLEVMTEAGRSWLMMQAVRHGFDLPAPEAIRVDGYDQLRLPRRTAARSRQKAQDICISVLDLDGVLEVREPDRFLSAIIRGFGKARAFGCGLMLIRRA
jgi:CRISPR system Cascade subunit CasE